MFNRKTIVSMKAYRVNIELITNLQVGNGEANFGVIDNLIQRDAATGFPCVNASSLKGALREHCNKYMNPRSVEALFGSGPNSSSQSAGILKFLDACLVSMPIRCGKKPYIMGTCPSLINDYLDRLELCGIVEPKAGNIREVLGHVKEKPVCLDEEISSCYLEDVGCAEKIDIKIGDETRCALVELLGDDFVIFPDESFSKLCDDEHLPVIARNCLQESRKNLWYEQVLPRFSRLSFVTVFDSGNDELKRLFFCVLEDCGLVQIGANATVGYGFCKLTPKYSK